MSLERVIKALVSLGLSRIDAEVYVYIAKKGSRKLIDLDMALNYSKPQISASLNTLTKRSLVNKDDTTFSALSFEEALELLIEQNKEQTQSMKNSKKNLLASWKKCS